MALTLGDIATAVGGEVVGSASQTIVGLSPIENIHPGSLVFAEGQTNLTKAKQSEAGALLVGQRLEDCDKPYVYVNNPHKAFVALLTLFHPQPKPEPGIHPTACVAEDAQLGNHVSIGPYVVIESGSVIGDHCVLKAHVAIGKGVILGEGCVLHPHVTLYDQCQLGARVIVHASSVLGSDGFGYSFDQGRHNKIPHVGRVIVEDDVEIGANTVIDRATLGATIIGQGTKIDNLVQVAHSVRLGKHNILCAFTGIAGSTVSGDRVIFAADVGVSDHVQIEDDVTLGARTGVPSNKHLKQGNVYLGNPARPKNKALELELSATRIPFIRKNQQILGEKLKDLETRLHQLEDNDS